MYVIGELTDNVPRDHVVPISMASLSKSVSLEQWHCRFAHYSLLTIAETLKGNLVDGLTISSHNFHGKCEDCIIGRQARRPFDRETEWSLDVLELVSFDLWGPSCVQTVEGMLYFMPIVDASSSYKHGAYLSDKSDSSTIAAFNTF